MNELTVPYLHVRGRKMGSVVFALDRGRMNKVIDGHNSRKSRRSSDSGG